MSLRSTSLANINFVLRTKCPLSPRRWWILRLLYETPILPDVTKPEVDNKPQVENEARAELPSKQGTSPEHLSSLEESLFKLSGQLSTISRNQKYFRTRENRNFSTVRSTESRIFNFSVIESLMMVTMSCLQVFIVRFFFQGARKGKQRLPSAPFHSHFAKAYNRLCVNGTCLFFIFLWTSLFVLQQIFLRSMAEL